MSQVMVDRDRSFARGQPENGGWVFYDLSGDQIANHTAYLPYVFDNLDVDLADPPLSQNAM